MFDQLDKDKRKENMTLDDSLLILANEVKGSYHDDCLEKKQQHILHIELGHGG